MNSGNERNKNVIILTVIAIATMIIVVVGATFAYLASTRMSTGEVDINATTSGGDSVFLINAGDELSIAVNESNLYYDEMADGKDQYPYVSDSTISTVQLMGSTPNTINYSINLNIESNNFKYTSGNCYAFIDETDKGIISGATTKSACSENIWSIDGVCYDSAKLNKTVDAALTNELMCTVKGNVWEKAEIAELVVDILKASNETINNCTNLGVCVDNANHRTKTTVTYANAGECESANADYEWISNYQDSSDRCYTWLASKDVTELPVSEDTEPNGSVVVDNIDVTVGDGVTSDTDYYYTTVTMRNLHHNQLVNGSKNFTARLIFVNKSI